MRKHAIGVFIYEVVRIKKILKGVNMRDKDSWDETFWAAEGRALVRTAKKKGGALLRP